MLPPLVGMNAAGWKAKILNPGLAGQTCRVAFGSSGKLAGLSLASFRLSYAASLVLSEKVLLLLCSYMHDAGAPR